MQQPLTFPRAQAQGAVDVTRQEIAMPNGALQGAALALVRIAVGFLWYQSIFFKLPGHIAGFHKGVAGVAKYSWVPEFGHLVKVLILPYPNFTVFASAIFLLELFIALSLLLGVLTRLGGLLGVLWGAMLFAGLAYAPGESAWLFGLLILLSATLALCAAGRSLGVDRWLRPLLLGLARRGNRLAYYAALAE